MYWNVSAMVYFAHEKLSEQWIWLLFRKQVTGMTAITMHLPFIYICSPNIASGHPHVNFSVTLKYCPN